MAGLHLVDCTFEASRIAPYLSGNGPPSTQIFHSLPSLKLNSFLDLVL